MTSNRNTQPVRSGAYFSQSKARHEMARVRLTASFSRALVALSASVAAPRRVSLLLAAFALSLTTMAAAPSHAVETYRSGSDVGVHYDPAVTCSSNPYYQVNVLPQMGTTPGWEWGQNVAYRIYVLDAATGQAVRKLNGGAWTSARIATKWTRTDFLGTTYTVTDTVAALPDYTFRVPAGRYQVRIDYAWYTNRGWSYATNVASSYANGRATFAGWQVATGNRCVISH